MSGHVFRRPHDYRPALVAVAAVLASAHLGDDPAVSRLVGQERFWEAWRPAPHIVQRAVLPAVLFETLAQPESPPAPFAATQYATWHAYRLPFQPRSFVAMPPESLGVPDAPPPPSDTQEATWAAYPASAIIRYFADLPTALLASEPADPPPIPSLAQAAFWSAYRPPFQPRSQAAVPPETLGVPDTPPLSRPRGQEEAWATVRPPPPLLQALSSLAALLAAPEPTDAPPIARPAGQELFWTNYRPLFWRAAGAVMPPESLGLPDAPPLARGIEQERFFVALRLPPPILQAMSPLAALLGAPLPDSPPLRSGAQDAAWAAYRYPRILAGGGASLPMALFPAPVVDDPPAPRPRGQEQFLVSYRPPFWRAAGVAIPVTLFPASDSGELGDCCDEILAAIAAIAATQAEILSRLSDLEASVSGGSSTTITSITQAVSPDLGTIIKYLRTILSDQKTNHDQTQRGLKKGR